MSRKVTKEDLNRRIVVHICRDGTISYRERGTPVFNGRALPVFTVDTIQQAEAIQVRFGRRQYVEHPQIPGKPWFRLSVLEDGTDTVQVGGLIEFEHLDGIGRMFAEFFHTSLKG